MKISLDDFSERYAFCDPASGKKEIVKSIRSRSAIVVIVIDSISRIFVLLAWAARCSTDKLIERIFEVSEAYKPRIFGCEANAMQSLFADAVRREARMSHRKLALTSISQSTKVDKFFRIRAAVQPVIAHGRLFIQPHQHELRNEVTSFPMSPTYDLIDALASAIALAPQRRIRQQRDAELDNLARYLRQSGASPTHIERRIAEVTQRRL